MKTIKLLVLVLPLLMTSNMSAGLLNVESEDIVRASGAGDKVDGRSTVNGKTFTRTVGGTVGKAVDMGLPSKTLWADHNIGASKPEEYGAYLAWAEVGAAEEGYEKGVKCQDGASYYAYSNLKYSVCQSTSYREYDKFTKYVESSQYGRVDERVRLEQEDDAATVNWGQEWMMPTFEQMAELSDSKYTVWTWVSRNGVEGYEVKSKKNGNTLFFPAASWVGGSGLEGNDAGGYYWTSTLGANGTCYAVVFYFTTDDYICTYGSRRCGRSVRPVRMK